MTVSVNVSEADDFKISSKMFVMQQLTMGTKMLIVR